VNRIRAGTEAPASVKGSTVTAAPTDEPGRTFDVQTHMFS
jgi:hypothetical protein